MREDFFIPGFYNQNRFYTRTRATIKILSLLRIFIKSFVLRKDERFGIRLYYFPVQHLVYGYPYFAIFYARFIVYFTQKRVVCCVSGCWSSPASSSSSLKFETP